MLENDQRGNRQQYPERNLKDAEDESHSFISREHLEQAVTGQDDESDEHDGGGKNECWRGADVSCHGLPVDGVLTCRWQ